MTRSKNAKKINFLLTSQEYQILKKYAETLNITMSEVLRDHIKSLKIAEPEDSIKS